MNQEQAQRELERVQFLARLKFPKYSRPMPRLEAIKSVRILGQAHYLFNVVKLNPAIYASEKQTRLTIAHEVAHFVARDLYMDTGHGKKWKEICKALGGDGERCADSEAHGITLGRKSFTYKAECGTVVSVSIRVHNKIQRGYTGYTVTKTGGKIKAEHYIK